MKKRKNPPKRQGCEWFTPPSGCIYPISDLTPLTCFKSSTETEVYDCVKCPAQKVNMQQCREREQESMRAYQ